jgi:hypothetical protein
LPKRRSGRSERVLPKECPALQNTHSAARHYRAGCLTKTSVGLSMIFNQSKFLKFCQKFNDWLAIGTFQHLTKEFEFEFLQTKHQSMTKSSQIQTSFFQQ